MICSGLRVMSLVRALWTVRETRRMRVKMEGRVEGRFWEDEEKKLRRTWGPLHRGRGQYLDILIRGLEDTPLRSWRVSPMSTGRWSPS